MTVFQVLRCQLSIFKMINDLQKNADAPAPYIARSSTALVLTMYVGEMDLCQPNVIDYKHLCHVNVAKW